jgi:hypothetical protein
MKSLLQHAVLLLALAVVPLAQAAETGRKARVATGAEVSLAGSAKTPAQWTAERPNVRALRPRVRGTLD